MDRLALIDGDVIRYQIGFACQRKIYKVLSRTFESHTDAADYAEQEGVPQEMIEVTLQADIIQSVYHTVDSFIHGILEKAKAETYRLFLTGEGNYRESLATIRPYKGQRSADKPIHFHRISEYLIRNHKAETIEGAEADDALGYTQYSHPNSVICTIDKDLNCIPGWHYDWKKDKLYNVSLPEADKFFYTQLLTGDTVDNIEGCPQIGSTKAEQILKGAGTPLEMYRRCQETYVQHHRKIAERFKTHCANDERLIFEAAMRDLEENAHLLWIQREEGVRWEAPA